MSEQPTGSFTQHTDRFVIDDDDAMDSNTTESDLSFKVTISLARDQSSKDAMQDSNELFFIWRMFMSSILEASVFMGKNYSENLHSIKKLQ